MKDNISRQQLNPLLDASAGIENAPYLVDSLTSGGLEATAKAYASCSACGCEGCSAVVAPGIRQVRSERNAR